MDFLPLSVLRLALGEIAWLFFVLHWRLSTHE